MTRTLLNRLPLAAALGSPVFIIFLSSNFVNAGNLAFNMIFSRWMGPALFADLAAVLTIKLALLGVLGAVQMAVSHRVAHTGGAKRPHVEQALSRINRICFVALWLTLPLTALAALPDAGGARLGLGSPWILLILAGSLPFTAPLSILRGVVLGRMETARVVASANAEMGVRLAGSILAWKAGLGIEGVAAAIALSIAAGWWVLRGSLAPAPARVSGLKMAATGLAFAALPFAVLQGAQVVLLDGDVILAKMRLSPEEAGYSAALSLFQRIQFFACFGLASALLPMVTAAAAQGGNVLRAALPAVALFAGIALPFLAGVILVPEALISAMAGAAFAPAAPLLPLAGGAAVAFTFSYLAATFLAALGDRRGIWLIAAAVPVQAWLMLSAPGGGLAPMLSAKLACQCVLALALAALCLWRVLRAPASAPAVLSAA